MGLGVSSFFFPFPSSLFFFYTSRFRGALLGWARYIIASGWLLLFPYIQLISAQNQLLENTVDEQTLVLPIWLV
ncbi:hypothetical protein BDV28DRAFT_143272 [Aspergillus coremiiformis]|uniref:Uncharacterized protein n=1 Tax=Aspergillus coremiiformis TaxID=138285 RepID=A0A5N6YXX6_9EURO|nr:hypothetical protein BDV28DRAFT_143272 [Aspergillus coremiiformis]